MSAAAPRRCLLAAAVMMLAACATPPPRPDPGAVGNSTTPPERIYVLRRGWHTDVVLQVADLRPPLSAIAGDFPGARYLVFGFGDRHYVLATHKDMGELLLAPLPGAGLVLVSALQGTPEEVYGSGHVAPVDIAPEQAGRIGDFIWSSLQHDPAGTTHPYLAGRYAGNLYYASTDRYSGLFTCNTWTARALKAGGIHVNSFGVLFAGQVWDQVGAARPAHPPQADH
ncbi:MAG: DUF2459 domain-containing protein [Nevskia sp.]|nr:DUF2459 domain-containing protein [Nevskia sp.]